jgi:hypothetical protein
MMFKRRLFVEDLFVPKKIINSFEWVEFESLEAFKKVRKDELYLNKNGTICHIHIHKVKDFIYLKNLNKELPNYFKDMRLYIEFDTLDLFEKVFGTPIEKEMKFSAILSEPFSLSTHWKINGEWIRKNVIALNHKISEATLENDVCSLLDIYNTKNLRFFLLDIDYESFQHLPIGELDRIEFFFYTLRQWTGGNQEINPMVILNSNSNKLMKRVFITKNLTLYLDSYKDDIWSFKLGDYLEENGNTIDGVVLNKLHTYLDLHSKALYVEMGWYNWFIISPRQILRMGYYINEIPLIMELIQRWLYG